MCKFIFVLGFVNSCNFLQLFNPDISDIDSRSASSTPSGIVSSGESAIGTELTYVMAVTFLREEREGKHCP
jgi:hypothetical protein